MVAIGDVSIAGSEHKGGSRKKHIKKFKKNQKK